MCYITFALLSRYFLNMSRAWLFVFNTRSYIYSKCKSPFTPKSVMNKPQTEGRVNHVCTEEHRRSSTLFSNKKQQWSTIVSLSKVIFRINMVELDHQRSAANTSVNKMRLDIFVLFNIFNYCRFASYSEFTFHCFNSFWWILNLFFCEWDELIHIHFSLD